MRNNKAVVAVLMGMLFLRAAAAQAAEGEAKTTDERFVSDAMREAKAAMEGKAASSAAVPAGSVEAILKAKGGVIIENPSFGGNRFLAISPEELPYEADRTARQMERARNICRMLGFDEPTIVAIEWTTSGDFLTVYGGSAVAQHYGSSGWGAYKQTAFFTRLGCAASNKAEPPAPAPPAKEAPAANPVEEALKAKGDMIIENPNFGGAPFLALTSQERETLNEEENAQKERARARNVCRMLGFAEPTISAVRRVDAGEYITVDDAGNAAAQTYDITWNSKDTYRQVAVFARLGCKK